MSHRLEENEDTKYTDYKEPKTPRTYSTIEPDAKDKEDSLSQRDSEGNIQTQNTESIWELARKSDNNSSSAGSRGSFSDSDLSVENVIEGIEKGANKARMPNRSSNSNDDNNSKSMTGISDDKR